MSKIFATNNKNFTKLENLMMLWLVELEKEVEDVNCKEMCTDRKLWNLGYEMSAPH